MGDKDNIASSVRSVLVTSKNGVPLTELEDDYLEITGEQIPYKSMGFKDLRSFLETIPMVKIDRINGVLVAISCSAASAHISKLVAGQKSKPKSKKKKKGKPTSAANRPYRNENTYSNHGSWKQTVNATYLSTSSRTGNSTSHQNNTERKVTFYPPVKTQNSYAPQSSSTNDSQRTVTYYPPVETSKPSEIKKSKSPPSNNSNNGKEQTKESQAQTSKCMEELKILAEENGWSEPLYEVTCIKQNVYYSWVLVGNSKFTSYPEGAGSEIQAKTIAAKRALQSLETDELNETLETDLMVDRIENIVLRHNEEMTIQRVEKLYSEKYNESLPKNWLTLVEESSEISQERRIVLVPKKLSMRSEVGAVIPLVEIDDPLKPLVVIRIESSIEIWVRYQSASEILEKFEKYYMGKQLSSGLEVVLQEGRYYALKHENKWHRVIYVSRDSLSKKAKVFFIDSGLVTTVDEKDLQFLSKTFLDIPAQAFRLAIYELLEWADYPGLRTILEKFLSHRRLVAAISKETITDYFGVYNVATFYDADTQIDINNAICDNFVIKWNETETIPNWDKSVFTAKITHITLEGEIFLQLASMADESLENSSTIELFTQMLTRLIEQDTHEKTNNFEIGSGCFAKDFNDFWYRAYVVGKENGKYEVFLVDYGHNIFVKSENMVLQKDNFLTAFPIQAFPIRLHNVSPALLLEKYYKFEELALRNPLLVKIIDPAIADPPTNMVVELFTRAQPGNALISINESVLSERNPAEKEPALLRSSTKALKPPHFRANEYYNVHVCNVNSPDVFMVQFQAFMDQIQDMNNKLQKVCEELSPAPVEIMKEKSFVAVKYKDELWHRGLILKTSGSKKFPTFEVYLCDIGKSYVCYLAKLRPLQDQFYDLPYQALMAKLSGVSSKEDWNESAILFFKKIVKEKTFIAYVKEITTLHDNPILWLELFDERENNINEMMISLSKTREK